MSLHSQEQIIVPPISPTVPMYLTNAAGQNLHYRPNRLHRESLSSELRSAYDILYYATMNFLPNAVIPRIDESLLSELFYMVEYDNPHMFWRARRYRYEIKAHTIVLYLCYSMSKERAQKCQIALFEEACALVTPIHKDDTPAECATIIHDRIITRKYNYAGEGSRAHSIDGALINNQAVCIGWSEAFKLCLDLAKIPCATVSCECIENGKHAGAHALNIVDLSDGHTPHWNVVDITFDGSKTGANRHPSHTYFGLSASQTQGRYEFLSWGFTPKLADSYSVYG